jgi:3-oxoacyl-[acyl-carrier protein] reductase
MSNGEDKSKLEEIINQLPNSENHSYLIVDFSNFEEYKIKIEAYLENNQVDILVNNTQGPSAGNSLSKILIHTRSLRLSYSKV